MFMMKDVSDKVLFAFLGLYMLIGLAVCTMHFTVTLQCEPKEIVMWNTWFLTSNLLVYAVSVVILIVRIIENRIAEENGAWEGGLGIFLLILLCLPHWITYGLSRISAAVGCSRASKIGFNSAIQILLTILHLFPFTDLIAAVILCRKWKRAEMLPATSD